MLIGYGAVAAFFAVVIVVLERTRRADADFADYAVAGRSFGSWYQTMSFLNTWLPGAVFISYAGMAAGDGVIGFYWVPCGLLVVVLMFFMAQRVHDWGRQWNLSTQADLLGMRYGSTRVRTVAAVIGVVSSFPWIVLGMQSLGLVFSYLSFGRVGPDLAILIGIAVLALRQVWTVRMGMRGIVISDMVQSIVAYVLGLCVVVGLLVWLLTNGHGLDGVPASHFALPGMDSAAGPLYLMSLVLTGTLGGWCWPDIFVRLFTARSTAVIKKSAVQAAPTLFVYSVSLTLLALVAASLPGVSDAPGDVWFIVAGVGGTLTVTAAGLIVLAATMGNVDANLQATGIQLSHDLLPKGSGPSDGRETRSAKLGVLTLTVLAAITAAATINSASGLASLAILSYQGICQLAPTLFLGIFWRRGNAIGAVGGMVSGFATAAALQVAHPISVPWLGGLTSGTAGLIVNTTVYVAAALLVRRTEDEDTRVGKLFDDLGGPDAETSAEATEGAGATGPGLPAAARAEDTAPR